MNSLPRFLLTLVALCPVALAAGSSALKLWYRQPATAWVEALPVGNGRMGAMVFGGTAEERIQFNEDTIWNGKPHEYHHEGAVKFLPELRRLLAGGKQKEAETLAMQEFMSVPLRQKAYQPCGDLLLSFPGHEAAADYVRALDLDSAVATTRYKVGDTTFTREVFASHPAQVIVVRLTADRPGRLTFSARLASPHQDSTVSPLGADGLALAGRVQEDGIRFDARLELRTGGGKVGSRDGALTVAGADSATLVLTAASSHVNYRDISADPAARCAAILAAAGSRCSAVSRSTSARAPPPRSRPTNA
jgi:alpha-L-fucosidase 2